MTTVLVSTAVYTMVVLGSQLSPFGFRRKKTPRTRPSSCCETCGARRGDSNAQPEMGEHQTEDRNEALHRGGISQLGFQEHAVSIKRITADPAKDTRQRINSVSSSCGAMPPAHPSSEVLPFDENDVTSSRRGSDQSPPQEMSSRYNASMREVISASTGVVDVGSRRPSILSIPMQGCGKSFSLRKISIGGQEESVPINSVVSRDMDGLPHSPSDLDERFASAIVIIPSPPPRIDFSDPFGGSGGFILEDGDTITSEARHIESRSVTDKEKRLEPSIWLSGGSEGQVSHFTSSKCEI